MPATTLWLEVDCGSHVQVRSCSLDTWLPGQVAFMAGTGNAVAAAFWEARLRPGRRPRQADSQGLEVTPAVPTPRVPFGGVVQCCGGDAGMLGGQCVEDSRSFVLRWALL